MTTFSIKELGNVKKEQEENTKKAFDALENKSNLGQIFDLRDSEKYEMPFINVEYRKINSQKKLVYLSSFSELRNFVFFSEAEANLANSLFIATFQKSEHGFNVNEFRFTLQSIKRMIGFVD